MPKQYSQKEIQERFTKLPEPLKDAVFSVEVAQHIYETGKKYGLTVDKIGVLGQEVGRIIMGLTMPSEFVQLMMSDFGIDETAARSMAGELNRLIFAPLRELLKNTHKYDISHEALQNTGPLTSPPSPPAGGFGRASPPTPPSQPRPAAPPAPAPTAPAVALPRAPISSNIKVPPPQPTPPANKPLLANDAKPFLTPPASIAPPASPPPLKTTPPLGTAPTTPPQPSPVTPSTGPGMDMRKVVLPETIKSVPPSQILQQNIMDTKKTPGTSSPPTENMQEAIFAPPTAPQDQQPAPKQSTQIPTPPVPPSPPPPPSSPAKGDPYREPVE